MKFEYRDLMCRLIKNYKTKFSIPQLRTVLEYDFGVGILKYPAHAKGYTQQVLASLTYAGYGYFDGMEFIIDPESPKIIDICMDIENILKNQKLEKECGLA